MDTNTAWLSRRLAALGVAVYRHTTVGDNRERLVAALSEAASRADVVISIGGLGPTSDDLTNAASGQATDWKMVEYPEARRRVDEMFNRFTGRKPPPSAYKQALFPEGSKLIFNLLGTAIGGLLELDEADYREVRFQSTDGLNLAGWWMPKDDPSRAVVLIPGP